MSSREVKFKQLITTYTVEQEAENLLSEIKTNLARSLAKNILDQLDSLPHAYKRVEEFDTKRFKYVLSINLISNKEIHRLENSVIGGCTPCQ